MKKRFVALVIMFIMLFSNICLAQPLPKKKETVYVNLDSYGKVTQVNIYSKWTTNDAEEIRDYTKYKSLSNLTNKEQYQTEDEATIWKVKGEKSFAYLGEVGEEYYNKIPWNFNISYKVNGVEVTQDQLLGAKGLVKIAIDINSNKETNEYYLNNYALEITGTYDMSKYLSVESEDAMITDTGNSKTLMFIVLPGQSTTINIEIGTNDFEMNGITMALVPITGDIKDKIVELLNDRDDIENAFDSINLSADIVLNTMAGMTSGLKGMSNGVTQMQEGTRNLHGLSELRDEDISNLKVLLEELMPIITDVQRDINNLNDTYDIIIELDEKLSSQTKTLNDNVNELNNDLDKLYKVMKDLPDDVEQINSLIRETAKVVGNTSTMVEKLSGTSSSTQEELTTGLTAIGTQTNSIATIAQQILATNPPAETQALLAQILSSAQTIGTNLNNVSETLQEMSDSMLDGADNLQSSLNKLKTKLNDVSEIMTRSDAKKVVNLIDSIRTTSKTLEVILNTVNKYNNQLLEEKDDFKLATTTMIQITDELNKMNTISTSMVTNAQNMLNILSNQIYNGTDATASALLSVNDQLIRVTSQSNQIKQSKDDVKSIIDKRKDKLEEKTTIFNLNKNTEVASFGSEKNENVDSVQFVLKTPDIKNVKTHNQDLESKKEGQSFWEKVGSIFQKIWNWITGLFK